MDLDQSVKNELLKEDFIHFVRSIQLSRSSYTFLSPKTVIEHGQHTFRFGGDLTDKVEHEWKEDEGKYGRTCWVSQHEWLKVEEAAEKFVRLFK